MIRLSRNALLAAGIAAAPSSGLPGSSVAGADDPVEPPVTVPPLSSDGCHGLLSPAQVVKATGLALTPGGGDQAGAPVPGLGDAAVTDRSHTLLVRRRTGVLLVYLVVAADPNADHLAALRATAVAGLGRL